MKIPSHLLSIRRAAKLLGVRRNTLRQLIRLGQLPAHYYNERPFIDPMSARAALDRAESNWLYRSA